jgi:predicted transcriptional regulator
MRTRIRKRPRPPEIGGLETKVLTHIWSVPEDTDAQSLCEALAAHSVSLSTIQTTLKRLHRKGLLARRRVGHAFLYRAAVTREGLISEMIEDMTHRLAQGDLEPVISGFFDLIDRANPALRDQLPNIARSDDEET